MSETLDQFERIRACLNAGEPLSVQSVTLPSGEWRVRWGVESAGRLETTAAGARRIAGLFEEENYLVEAVPLLRSAQSCSRRPWCAHCSTAGRHRRVGW